MKIHILVLLLFVACTSKKEVVPVLQRLNVPTESLLQAISIVDEETVWISGHDGSFVRSSNGGENWDLFTHPTGDTLQFRDVHGFSQNKAVLMSAGPGPLSRIFTFYNDSIWQENFVMEDTQGFLDCIDFWDADNGIAYGDAVDDYPYILLTMNGGQSWERAPTNNMPKAGAGEGGFAASGTCVTVAENGKAWIATGAGGNCRVLLTLDYGQSWNEVASPLIQGDAAGNTSVSFSGDTGFLTGGDLTQTDVYTKNCAFSVDGGNTWTLTENPKTTGVFYGGAISKVNGKIFAFACGPNGLDYTSDMGQSWASLDTLDYWAVAFKENIGIVSGRDGEVLKITLQ
ncbi:MAG: hypothetical protein ABJP45_19170 [Cyclobacteriaceae bacterium]